jgi:putative ABC transport system substrate-binding protein
VVAADLVRLKPDVIVAATSPAAKAAHEATKTIPLVFVNVGDPVGLGLAASLARPGGNATGTASYGPELAQKVLEVAKDLTPQTRHVALVWNPGNPLHARTLRDKALEGPAHQLGIELRALKAATPDELEPAFRAAAAWRADVVWVFGDQVFFVERTRIAAYALSERLPTMFNFRQHVEAGGLASYGADVATMYRRAAVQVDKILKGARPGDIPIEQPTRFELVINLKTAKALGLTIPQSLLLRADQVIE